MCVHVCVYACVRKYVRCMCVRKRAFICVCMYIYMGQVIEKRTIGAGQAKIINLTITLNNFITLEDQLIPFI